MYAASARGGASVEPAPNMLIAQILASFRPESFLKPGLVASPLEQQAEEEHVRLLPSSHLPECCAVTNNVHKITRGIDAAGRDPCITLLTCIFSKC